MSLIMQCRYQFWKIRCAEVMKMEKPARVARMIEEARELEGDIGLVEPRDRHLFDPVNLPGEDDQVQKIEDWVEAVRRSKTRMKRREERGRRTMDAFLGGKGETA